MGVGEAEFGETLEEPGGAGLLGEGWGGDGEEVELPEAELGLVEVQPGEGAVHGELGGEAGDAVLGGGGFVGHELAGTEAWPAGNSGG